MDPNLVVRDTNGQIYTVRYEAVNAVLLNEFLKERKKVVKEQASQIEKVNAWIEVTGPVAHVAANKP